MSFFTISLKQSCLIQKQIFFHKISRFMEVKTQLYLLIFENKCMYFLTCYLVKNYKPLVRIQVEHETW